MYNTSMKSKKQHEPDFCSPQYEKPQPRHVKKIHHDQNPTNHLDPFQQNHPSRKSKKKGSTFLIWLYRLIGLAAICVFCYAAWNLYGIWKQDHQIKQENEALQQYIQANEEDQTPEKEEYFTMDWEGIKAQNSQVVAWIAIPGTDISYPIVQGEDNSYYLNHTLQGEYNDMGSIFLDTAANPQFLDDNSIIYGHSVSDIGGMFTNLEKFNDQEFFDTHPYFWLMTPTQNYRVTAYVYYSGDDEGMIYTTDFGDYQNEVLQQIQSESKYVRQMDTQEKRFISLSTCDLTYGFQSNQRYVLMGALEEWNELIPLSEVK